MRPLWTLCAVLLAAAPALFPWGAGAAVIGGPLLRDGLEIVPSTLTGVELDRPAVLSRAADSVFLVADVHAAKDEAHGFAEHAFIPYLSISYALTKDDAPTFKKAGLLYPVAAKDGPHYGASAEMAGPGHLPFDLHHIAAQFARHDAPDRQGGRRARLVEADHRQLDLHLPSECKMKTLVVALAFLLVAPAFADAPITVHLKNHRFSPATIKVKANQPAMTDPVQ